MIEGNYLSINELAKLWDVHPRTVQIMCREGRIEGAVKFGRSWAVPEDAKRPNDGRVKSGEYKGWRKKNNKGSINVWTIIIILAFLSLGLFIATFLYRENKYEKLIATHKYEEAIQFNPHKEEAYIRLAESHWNHSNGARRDLAIVFREKACEVVRQGLENVDSAKLSDMLNDYERNTIMVTMIIVNSHRDLDRLISVKKGHSN